MGWTAERGAGKAVIPSKRALLLAALVVCALPAIPRVSAQSRRPIPAGRVASGLLSFDGHATVGDFTGTTTTVTGEIKPASDLAGVQGWVEAPVQSLKTGDGKRDKDLNKSMESKKYPTMRFVLERIAPAGSGEAAVPVILHGALSIHGVTRTVELPATIRFEQASARVRTDFPLNLKDYDIGGLSKMLGMLKMNENIEVHVNLVFQGKTPG
ncbi:MAG: YceI family protein [Gemmatimonadales bacterium]